MGNLRSLFLKHAGLFRITLSIGALLTGVEEMCEAFFVSFEGIFELYHAVIFVSTIHIIHAVEEFIEAREKVKHGART